MLNKYTADHGWQHYLDLVDAAYDPLDYFMAYEGIIDKNITNKSSPQDDEDIDYTGTNPNNLSPGDLNSGSSIPLCIF